MMIIENFNESRDSVDFASSDNDGSNIQSVTQIHSKYGQMQGLYDKQINTNKQSSQGSIVTYKHESEQQSTKTPRFEKGFTSDSAGGYIENIMETEEGKYSQCNTSKSHCPQQLQSSKLYFD
jgi:hypothetical protein